jgi:hypothetical protein
MQLDRPLGAGAACKGGSAAPRAPGGRLRARGADKASEDRIAESPVRLEFDAVAGVIGNTTVVIAIREQFPGRDGLQRAVRLHENEIDTTILGQVAVDVRRLLAEDLFERVR